MKAVYPLPSHLKQNRSEKVKDKQNRKKPENGKENPNTGPTCVMWSYSVRSVRRSNNRVIIIKKI